MNYSYNAGVITPFFKRNMRALILAVAGVFVFMQMVMFIAPTSAVTANVSNEAEFNAALADSNNDTISLDSSFSTTSQITILREVTINGNGYTIDAAFTKTSNSNNSAIGIQSDNVVINNLVVTSTGDEPWPLQLHGINVFTSEGVVLNSVTATDFEGYGVLVNGSNVVVDDITTLSNGWGGINVDQGLNVEDPAVLTVNGISIHTDLGHIYSDHYFSGDVTINDTNDQYLVIDNPVDPNDYDDDRLYQLDPERFTYTEGNSPNLKINICHAPGSDSNPYVINPINLNGLNGHDGHDDDIIPPNPDMLEGQNWTRENIDIWENGCEDGEVLGTQCSISLLSDTSNFVVEKNDNAKDLDFDHPSWVDEATLAPAVWIWGDNPVVDPSQDETQTFQKVFGWNGPITSAKLDISADNGYEVYLNGALVVADADPYNWQTVDSHDISGELVDGLNVLEIVVTNYAGDSNPASNPAGLLYSATITGTDENCDETPPHSKVVAHKIVCENEATLPNDGYSSIGPDTAEEFVSQNEGCELVQNWQYQYRLSGSSSPEPIGYGELDGWETFTNSEHIVLSGNTTIQLREVLPEGYIPFTGQNSQDDVSAEFYCNTDAANFDNWEWITNPQDGATYYCVAWNVPEVQEFTLNTQKVVCSAEEYLPNWGDGGPAVTSDTAQDYVEASNGNCWLADWEFQWAPGNVGNPGDNVDYAGDPWSTFSGSINLPTDAVGEGNDRIWVREVANDSYIPFTGQGTEQDVSAEMYCNNDVLNYDNWDWIMNPEADETYHCVGFNVLKPVVLNAQKIECVAEEFLPNWGDGQSGQTIGADTAQNYVDNSEGNCELIPWEFQWNIDGSGDPEDNTGALGDDWQTFNSSTEIWLDALENNDLRVREVWNENYIPFTGQNTDQDVSAELHCYDDVLHYDNWEWINDVQPGDEYYCVAWNVEVDLGGTVTVIKWNDTNGDGTQNDNGGVANSDRLPGWTIRLYDDEWNPVSEHLTGDFNLTRAETKVPGVFSGYYICEVMQEGWVQSRPNGSHSLDRLNESPNADEEGEYCFTFNDGSFNASGNAGRAFGNYQPIGQIAGLVYNDTDNNGIQDEDDPELNDWKVWLLTKNSPYTVADIYTTSDSDPGAYLFENLEFGTYYVCQQLPEGWDQTQIDAGTGGVLPGSEPSIGDVLELDDEDVTEFCYMVELTDENPESLENIFGNYNALLGESIDRTNDDGDVLGESTGGQVLAESGFPTIAVTMFGTLIGTTAALLGSRRFQNR